MSTTDLNSISGVGERNGRSCQSWAVRPMGCRFGAIAGSILGAVMWLLVASWIARDWLALAIILITSLGLFVCSLVATMRMPGRYWDTTVAMLIALVVLSFAMVNWRWAWWTQACRASVHYRSVGDIPL